MSPLSPDPAGPRSSSGHKSYGKIESYTESQPSTGGPNKYLDLLETSRKARVEKSQPIRSTTLPRTFPSNRYGPRPQSSKRIPLLLDTPPQPSQENPKSHTSDNRPAMVEVVHSNAGADSPEQPKAQYTTPLKRRSPPTPEEGSRNSNDVSEVGDDGLDLRTRARRLLMKSAKCRSNTAKIRTEIIRDPRAALNSRSGSLNTRDAVRETQRIGSMVKRDEERKRQKEEYMEALARKEAEEKQTEEDRREKQRKKKAGVAKQLLEQEKLAQRKARKRARQLREAREAKKQAEMEQALQQASQQASTSTRLKSMRPRKSKSLIFSRSKKDDLEDKPISKSSTAASETGQKAKRRSSLRSDDSEQNKFSAAALKEASITVDTSQGESITNEDLAKEAQQRKLEEMARKIMEETKTYAEEQLDKQKHDPKL